VPTNAPYWVKWTTPDTGFNLINGSSVVGVTNWNSVPNTTPVAQGGAKWALIPGTSLLTNSTSFYGLVKRTFTQLQVLFPGETNAPNTATGKIGTPDPLSLSGGAAVNVTVNAVDSTFHIVSTAPANQIGLSSSDVNASLPPLTPLANGTFTGQVFFSATGSFTITATNMSTVMPSATSSPITVGP
jgi:hypothetical protein